MNWFKKVSVKKEDLKPGSWVKSYSEGIFRIERFVDTYFEPDKDNYSTNGGNHPERIVVLKRLLNSKFKKSISYDSCAESLISPLTAEEQDKLHNVLKENPSFVDILNNYKIPVIESIYNMDMKINSEGDLAKVHELITFIKTGKSFMEIKKEMQQNDLLKLVPKFSGNYLLQLINFDFEYLDKKQIWRDARLTSTKDINEK